MIKVGITGSNGFIGWHLKNNLSLIENFKLIPFERGFFEEKKSLDNFTSNCDIIIHLAGINRHDNEDFIYKTNINLAQKLVDSLNRTKSKPYVIMSSSTQEDLDNNYGNSKKTARKIFTKWSEDSGSFFSGLIIPGVFGSFSKPNYNSVVSTFCHKIINDEITNVIDDKEIKLIYIDDLINLILDLLNNFSSNKKIIVKYNKKIMVSQLLEIIKEFNDKYVKNKEIPFFKSKFEFNLFNTFRSYIDCKSFFPVRYKKHNDNRGSFVELLRTSTGGQFSYSTTQKGVVRGNHFHTRKIERFSVIAGKALIQIRKIGTNEIIEFILDGDNPSYVDMPLWYTHNIKNIGDDILFTNFWINEPYDPKDPDTFMQIV